MSDAATIIDAAQSPIMAPIRARQVAREPGPFSGSPMLSPG